MCLVIIARKFTSLLISVLFIGLLYSVISSYRTNPIVIDSQAEIFFQNGLECLERRSWERAQNFLSQANHLQHPKAAYHLSVALHNSPDFESTHQAQFISILEPLARAGDDLAARDLGMYYLDHDERQKGSQLLLPLSEKGDELAACRLTLDHLTECNYTDCALHLESLNNSSLEKTPVILYHLAIARLRCNPNESEFIEELTHSAEKGFLPAQEHLGRMYFYPNPWAERNMDASKKWFEIASSYNYAPAMYQLGLWHFSQDNDSKALEWIERAAKKGHKDAQYFMGRHNELMAVPQKNIILSWYEKAAEQNDLLSLNRLGILYAQGVYGLEQDYTQSRTYFEKSAQGGLATAQNNLGLLYFYHTIPSPNHDKDALYWFEKAAEQSYYPAEHNIEILTQLSASTALDQNE